MRLLKLLSVLAAGLIALPAVAQSMRFPVPTPGLMPNPAAGKKLFAARCAQCHGADLRGSPTGPPLLHKIYEPAHHGDVAFQLAVRIQ